MEPKVFIIVLNWNNWSDTIGCLESLNKANYPNFEIVVVDNGSKEKMKIPVLQPGRYSPKIKVFYNKKNLGFSGGNNIGINYALNQGADYALLLNNDTIVDNNFLNELIEAAEKDEKIGILGPKIYYHKDPQMIWSAGGKIVSLGTRGIHIGLDEIDIHF